MNDIDRPTSYGYRREYVFLGSVGRQVGDGLWEVDVKNQIRTGTPIEYIGSDVYRIKDDGFTLVDADGNPLEKLDHGKVGFLKTDKMLRRGYIIRSESKVKTIN